MTPEVLYNIRTITYIIASATFIIGLNLLRLSLDLNVWGMPRLLVTVISLPQ